MPSIPSSLNKVDAKGNLRKSVAVEHIVSRGARIVSQILYIRARRMVLPMSKKYGSMDTEELVEAHLDILCEILDYEEERALRGSESSQQANKNKERYWESQQISEELQSRDGFDYNSHEDLLDEIILGSIDTKEVVESESESDAKILTAQHEEIFKRMVEYTNRGESDELTDDEKEELFALYADELILHYELYTNPLVDEVAHLDSLFAVQGNSARIAYTTGEVYLDYAKTEELADTHDKIIGCLLRMEDEGNGPSSSLDRLYHRLRAFAFTSSQELNKRSGFDLEEHIRELGVKYDGDSKNDRGEFTV
jgi:hypothetical protein